MQEGCFWNKWGKRQNEILTREPYLTQTGRRVTGWKTMSQERLKYYCQISPCREPWFLWEKNRDPHSFVSKKILPPRPLAVGLVGARSRTRMINNCSRLQWKGAFFSHHDWNMTMKWTSNEKWCHRQNISPLQDRVPNVQRVDDEYLDIWNSFKVWNELWNRKVKISIETRSDFNQFNLTIFLPRN